jgi:hypothetical protein
MADTSRHVGIVPRADPSRVRGPGKTWFPYNVCWLCTSEMYIKSLWKHR